MFSPEGDNMGHLLSRSPLHTDWILTYMSESATADFSGHTDLPVDNWLVVGSVRALVSPGVGLEGDGNPLLICHQLVACRKSGMAVWRRGLGPSLVSGIVVAAQHSPA